MTTNITPINGTEATHIEPGDPVQVLFEPGWASGWKLVGCKSTGDERRVIVERIEDGAVLGPIRPELVRKV